MPDVAAAAVHYKSGGRSRRLSRTCVLLDVVRAPLRNAAGNVGAATEVLTGANRPANHLPSHRMPDADRVGAHIDDAVQTVKKPSIASSAVSASCAFAGLPALGPLPAGLATLPDRLKTLSKILLDASILLDKEAMR